jgi:hypothetical protein
VDPELAEHSPFVEVVFGVIVDPQKLNPLEQGDAFSGPAERLPLFRRRYFHFPLRGFLRQLDRRIDRVLNRDEFYSQRLETTEAAEHF